MCRIWEICPIDEVCRIWDMCRFGERGLIDEKFLEGVAYRIPTENKYSMIQFKIAG